MENNIFTPPPANVAAYYAARDGLRAAMEGQHETARAYVMPDMFTAIDDITAAYRRIGRAATKVRAYADIVERRARELALIVNDGHTLYDVYAYETARTNHYLAAIKRGE